MYGECTMHYIKSSTLDKLVDEAVRKIARYILRNEQAFLEQVRVLTSADQKQTQSEDKKELVIDKVVVHEATGGRTADRSQQIDIYFNFIGQFMVEDTEEELLMQEQEAQRLADLKERERKDRRNETVRRYRQRKKEREAKQAESVSG